MLDITTEPELDPSPALRHSACVRTSLQMPTKKKEVKKNVRVNSKAKWKTIKILNIDGEG